MKHPDMASQDELIYIGVITKPHGIRGEVKVKPLTDFPSRFRHLSDVFLVLPDSSVEKHMVEKVRVQKAFVLLKLKNSCTISDAERLVNAELAIPRSECVELPEDTFFLFDLIGMKAVLSHGEQVGEVVDVQNYPAQDILVVRTNENREVMVPFVKALVPSVSLESGIITVKDLPGLFTEE